MEPRRGQCFDMVEPLPTVLYYTHVDDQCDKLVTDDRHQFITLTVHVILFTSGIFRHSACK